MSTPTEDDARQTRPAEEPTRELEAPDHLDTDPGTPPSGVVKRRVLPWLVPLLTAVLGVALGLGIGLGWGRWWQPQPTVIASAALVATGDWPTSTGNATVEVTPQGERYVTAWVSTPPPRDGYRQVWLVTEDGTGFYPLGAMIGDERRFPLPPGLDLSVYPTVEVSYQLIDGKPAHTGNTMLRGQLN